MSLPPPEMLALLAEVERDCPVNDWRVGGIRAWPLIRIWAWHHGTQDAGRIGGGRARTLLRRAATFLDALWAPLRDGRRNAPRIQAADAFFFGPTVSRQALLGGEWTDVAFQPLLSALERRGGRGHVWEWSLTEPYRRPRAGRAYPAQRELLGVRGGAAEAVLGGYPDALERLRGRGVPVERLSPERIAAELGLVLALAERLEEVLREVAPKAAFTANVSRYELALHLAARRRGIPSVELQHGVQGANHGLYARWTRAPREGYELLPGAYWCWDASSAASINAWSSACAPRHRAVAGGNPWFSYCAGLEPASVDPRFAGFPGDAGGRARVLVTLQPPETIYEPGRLLPAFVVDAMSRLSDRCEWWIRFHPLMRRNDDAIRAHFAGRPVRLEFDAANALPLHLLLRGADLNMTHSSSTVLDAARVGVRSVVWSKLGEEFLAEAIASGAAVPAGTAGSMEEALRSGLAAGRFEPPTRPPRVDDVLDSFLRPYST